MNTDLVRKLHEAGYSRSRAAATLGVSLYHLDCMAKEAGLVWQIGLRPGRITIQGQTATWKQHARRYGLSIGTLRYRLENGIPLEGPIEKRPVTREEALRFFELRKSGLPAWKAADQVGRSYTNLNKAARTLFPDYRETIKRLPRKRRPNTTRTPELEKDFLSSKERKCPVEKSCVELSSSQRIAAGQ